MLKKLLTLSFLTILTFSLTAQDKATDLSKTQVAAAKDQKEGWTKVGSLGLGFDLLNLINPRPGQGDNLTRYSAALTYGANLLRGKMIWNNKFGWLLGAQKVGGDPFTKSADALLINSQLGYQVGASGKWYVGGMADFQSQLLPTYGKNYFSAKPTGKETTPLNVTGALFSPANIKFAPGIIYKPNADWSFLYSPAGIKAVIVSEDSMRGPKNSTYFPFDPANPTKSVDFQIGSELRVDFSKKFADGKVVYQSTLDLYSNYLRDPQNIDIEWFNSLDFMITKNIAVTVKTDWFYDHDILVTRSSDGSKGPDVFIRNFVGLKYATTF
jgi:Protein of unknown function (DUF3078)